MINAITTKDGLEILKSEYKSKVADFILIGAVQNNDEELNTILQKENLSFNEISNRIFYKNSITRSYYDEKGVLTFDLDLDAATNFSHYTYAIGLISSIENKTTLISYSLTPKIAFIKGVGGSFIYKVEITGEAGEIVLKTSNYLTKIELAEYLKPIVKALSENYCKSIVLNIKNEGIFFKDKNSNLFIFKEYQDKYLSIKDKSIFLEKGFYHIKKQYLVEGTNPYQGFDITLVTIKENEPLPKLSSIFPLLIKNGDSYFFDGKVNGEIKRTEINLGGIFIKFPLEGEMEHLLKGEVPEGLYKIIKNLHEDNKQLRIPRASCHPLVRSGEVVSFEDERIPQLPFNFLLPKDSIAYELGLMDSGDEYIEVRKRAEIILFYKVTEEFLDYSEIRQNITLTFRRLNEGEI